MFAASLTSYRVRLDEPVKLRSTEVAPEIDTSSSSGEEIARWAASTARCWPLPWPTPMSARPLLAMMVRTSAKSTLMMPW